VIKRWETGENVKQMEIKKNKLSHGIMASVEHLSSLLIPTTVHIEFPPQCSLPGSLPGSQNVTV
jgi:hypothetical protein